MEDETRQRSNSRRASTPAGGLNAGATEGGGESEEPVRRRVTLSGADLEKFAAFATPLLQKESARWRRQTSGLINQQQQQQQQQQESDESQQALDNDKDSDAAEEASKSISQRTFEKAAVSFSINLIVIIIALVVCINICV